MSKSDIVDLSINPRLVFDIDKVCRAEKYGVSYLRCLCRMLKTISAMAARIPAMQSAVMHAKSGRETVRSSLTTTVRSGGTFPPAQIQSYFMVHLNTGDARKTHINLLAINRKRRKTVNDII